jgi:ADP-heptose:LPS heptosyltransferase
MNNKIIISPMIGIGDVLMTTPALEIIKKNIPESEITYCTMNKGVFDVLKENPNIDNLVYYPLLSKNVFSALVPFLKEQSCRHYISLNFYPSNRIHYNIISLLTFARQRIGHTYLRMNFSQLNWLKNKTIIEDDSLHCVEENIRLLQLLGIKVSVDSIPPMSIYLNPQEIESGMQFRRTISPTKCCIGVHAGTSVMKGHSARRWSKEKFSEVINTIEDAHFVLFGTKEEFEANQFIHDNVEPGRVTFVNNKTIREAAAIIKACDFFLSNDSGLMHLAAATGTPVIALIGPTNPVYIKPWNVPHKVVSAPNACCHCFRYSPKPLTCVSDKKFECLTEITVAMVEKEIRAFIDSFCMRSLK